MNEDSTVDSVLNSDEVEVSWLPKADASYKRSPALLHQISLLRQGDGLDYVVSVICVSDFGDLIRSLTS